MLLDLTKLLPLPGLKLLLNLSSPSQLLPNRFHLLFASQLLLPECFKLLSPSQFLPYGLKTFLPQRLSSELLGICPLQRIILAIAVVVEVVAVWEVLSAAESLSMGYCCPLPLEFQLKCPLSFNFPLPL